MKLSEYKGEEAIELLADIIEPAAKILADKECAAALKNKEITKAVKIGLKAHKREVIEIMAALDGVPVDQYEVNLFTLPVKLLELLNDPDLMAFFDMQGQKKK